MPEPHRPASGDPAKTPDSPTAPVPSSAAAPPAVPLTPEEQMERFARELKEQDWGHQPC